MNNLFALYIPPSYIYTNSKICYIFDFKMRHCVDIQILMNTLRHWYNNITLSTSNDPNDLIQIYERVYSQENKELKIVTISYLSDLPIPDVNGNITSIKCLDQIPSNKILYGVRHIISPSSFQTKLDFLLKDDNINDELNLLILKKTYFRRINFEDYKPNTNFILNESFSLFDEYDYAERHMSKLNVYMNNFSKDLQRNVERKIQ